MIMDLFSQSTRPPVTALVRPKDVVALHDAIPSSLAQAARATTDDQGSYDAAVSEVWPLLVRHERGTIPPFQRESTIATELPDA
jgi:hypothetical protein